MSILFAITTGVLFGLGIFLMLRRDLLKAAMGFYIVFTAINLFFLAVGAFQGEAPAYVGAEGQPSDPLVQALILTAVVISFGSFALLLGLVRVAARRFGTIDADSIDELQG
ncbi:MAG: NADH-quinone oxidoreductase subunit K [Anaerolineae bacterium]